MGNSTLEAEMTQGRKEAEELFRSKLEVVGSGFRVLSSHNHRDTPSPMKLSPKP